MQLEFEIKGKVKAKQSVKFTKGGVKYTPSDIAEYSNYVKLCFINKYPSWNVQEFVNKPLKTVINVYMQIPESYSKKKKELARAGNLKPTVKPDCDNIAKNINDSLNGVAYPDDKQIVSLTINKYYADSDCVIVTISD